jgi:hypothetical protein
MQHSYPTLHITHESWAVIMHLTMLMHLTSPAGNPPGR